MAGDELGPIESEERLVLGEMLNHVLDKGVVIAGDITISVADIVSFSDRKATLWPQRSQARFSKYRTLPQAWQTKSFKI